MLCGRVKRSPLFITLKGSDEELEVNKAFKDCFVLDLREVALEARALQEFVTDMLNDRWHMGAI